MFTKANKAAWFAAALAACAWGATVPAQAGKANDTLTIAEVLPLGTTDIYFGSFPHVQFLSNMIFDSLVDFDPLTQSIVPLLATSWTEEGDAIEFQLREGVTWHDGTPFTAEDVAHTLSWLVHPDSRFQNKFQWAWIKSAEATGTHSVRVETNGRKPDDLLLLVLTPIYPAHIHSGLAEKSDFGRNPIGTGPYKVEQFDTAGNRLVAVRNPDYQLGGTTKTEAKFGTVVMRTIPDQGSQISSLMVGEVDIFRGLPADQAKALAMDPRFDLTVNGGIGVTFVWFDAKGAAGNEAMTDRRVREAISIAIDRSAVDQIINGDLDIPLPENMCWNDRVLGCHYTVTVPEHDLARARELLAEAGHSNLTVRISSYVGRMTTLAEAVSGELAKVGVTSTIEPLTVTTFTSKRDNGELQLVVTGNTLRGIPDVGQQFAFFFESYDMTGDPQMMEIGHAMKSEMDPEKRKEIAAQFYDRLIENFYLVPLTSMPQLMVHTRDLELDTSSNHTYGFDISRIDWVD